jgi:hypothetical protein
VRELRAIGQALWHHSKNRAGSGQCALLYVTDEQWGKSVTVIGPNYEQGNRAKDPKVANQVEFWD